MSCTRCCRPLTRLSPPVSTIFRTATGLPSTKLLGASASVTSDAKNCARPFSTPSSVAVSATALAAARPEAKTPVADAPTRPRRGAFVAPFPLPAGEAIAEILVTICISSVCGSIHQHGQRQGDQRRLVLPFDLERVLG